VSSPLLVKCSNGFFRRSARRFQALLIMELAGRHAKWGAITMTSSSCRATILALSSAMFPERASLPPF